MARDSGGTHTLPAGNPVVTGTTITPTWANTTLDDLSDEITDSLSRSGKGGMTAALKEIDGTVSVPSYAFTNDAGVGMYRSASGEGSLAAGAAQAAKWTVAGFFASLVQSITAVSLRLMGRAATSGTAVGVILDTDTTYAAGDKILSVRSNTSEKASISYDGTITTGGSIVATGTGTFTGGIIGGVAAKTKTSDTTEAVGTITDVGDMSFSVDANTSYYFRFIALCGSASTACGVQLGVNGPASPTEVRYTTQWADSAGVQTFSGQGAYGVDTNIVSSVSAASKFFIQVEGFIRNGANAGTFTMRMKSETGTNTVTVYTGSTLLYARL